MKQVKSSIYIAVHSTKQLWATYSRLKQYRTQSKIAVVKRPNQSKPHSTSKAPTPIGYAVLWEHNHKRAFRKTGSVCTNLFLRGKVFSN